MNKLRVSQEIDAFMIENKFREITIKNEKAYVLNGEIYYFTEENDFAALEYAESIEAAEKYMRDDIAAYDLKNFTEDGIIALVKEDITKYIIQARQASKKVDILEIKPMKPGEVFIHCVFKDAPASTLTDKLERFRLDDGHEFPVAWTMLSDSLKDRIFAVIVSNDFPLAPYPNTGVFV
jgi:hypothetical protein